MFNFNYACIDGVSSVKLCYQFLNNLNKLANDASYVEKDIESLQLSSYFHDMINKTRKSHFICERIMGCGLRPILKYLMIRFTKCSISKKPDNPLYSSSFQYHEDKDCQFSVKVFTVNETERIVKACRKNHCTVTGLLLAIAQYTICCLLKHHREKKIEYKFAINSRRFCPKPPKDYIGLFAYVCQEFISFILNKTQQIIQIQFGI